MTAPNKIMFATHNGGLLRRYGTRGLAMGLRDKLLDLSDAVALVRGGDTLSCSGFVAQGAPETLLEALGKRFRDEKADANGSGKLENLTLLFGGGPGGLLDLFAVIGLEILIEIDWGEKGLNHMGQKGLIRRAIGAHYGQVPKIANLVLANEIEAWALPLGSISRMYRASASRSSRYTTKIGLGTFVDPRLGGGKLNKKTIDSGIDMVTLNVLDQVEYLAYPAVPTSVAFIKATTADPDGNLTFERESMLGDSRLIAMATKSSGGIVIAEVERLAMKGSLNARSVHIPGILVDGVVLIKDESKVHMSYFTKYNPAWSSEIRPPMNKMPAMKFDCRKIIARRAAMELLPNDVVNLGIGMPEGVANIASEENFFENITLTTEAGLVGGIGASGHDFGPGPGGIAIQEMNQQFDFYNGGGLSIAFLGMGEVSKEGNVNVSRLCHDKLTGPGGFIDITQCTHRVVFMGTFTKNGLKLKFSKEKDHPLLTKVGIAKEGEIRTFRQGVYEITFSGERALKLGQKVLYITERCVFELDRRGIEILEIAPGMDLQKDILDKMDFVPSNAKDILEGRVKLKQMDPRIFDENLMNLNEELFGASKQILRRLHYHKESHTLTMDLSHFVCNSRKEFVEIMNALENALETALKEGNGEKVNVIVNYEGFDVCADIAEDWWNSVKAFEEKYYKSIRRYRFGPLFLRSKLGQNLNINSEEDVWKKWTTAAKKKTALSRAEVRTQIKEMLNYDPNQEELEELMSGKETVTREDFPNLLAALHSRAFGPK